jgi:hypothetical protein
VGRWEANEVKEFLLEQPETDFVTLNSQKYYRRPDEPITPPPLKKRTSKKKVAATKEL